jgi:hypothetical protein
MPLFVWGAEIILDSVLGEKLIHSFKVFFSLLSLTTISNGNLALRSAISVNHFFDILRVSTSGLGFHPVLSEFTMTTSKYDCMVISFN